MFKEKSRKKILYFFVGFTYQTSFPEFWDIRMPPLEFKEQATRAASGQIEQYNKNKYIKEISQKLICFKKVSVFSRWPIWIWMLPAIVITNGIR